MYGLITQKFHTPATRSERRPMGVSRREKHRSKKRRQLGFEPLEARQMLSAESPLAGLQIALTEDIQSGVHSLSSATPEGQAAILQNELFWQSLIAANTAYAPLSTLSIPTDPLVSNQWHLINTGQEVGNPDFQPIFGVPGEDINIAGAWNLGYTGAGVVVAVIDSGVEDTHPDLLANISTTLQFDAIDLDSDANPRPESPQPIDPLDPDPPTDPREGLVVRGNAHGTEVAGLIGAVADNSLGGTGVAPGVTLVPIRLIDSVIPTNPGNPTIDAFRYATDEIDITNNSWGPQALPGLSQRFLSGPTSGELIALRDTIIGPNAGRDGLGIIHVFASGNNGESPYPTGTIPDIPIAVSGLDSSGYNGWINSRYTIGITGVDHDGFYDNVDGTVTAYPETSASVLVAAPTGSNSFINHLGDDTGLGSGIYTTDFTGEGGSNYAPDPITNQEFDRDFLANTDYTSRFNGTSASAPIATGVIALMLEANPDLSWRDVQEILVRSARQNAEFDVPQNGSDQGDGTTRSQNLWITNQKSLFHDPDPYDPSIDPFLQTFHPTLDPNIGNGFSLFPTTGNLDKLVNTHYAPAPQVNTNAAGFTISQGKGANGEQIGYAHGVVDAELAVQLAAQWTTKGQNLPDELSFTSFITTDAIEFAGSIPAAEKGSAATVGSTEFGGQLVPGSLNGLSGFISRWEEYFADEPDLTQTFPFRGAPLGFSVPDNNTVSIENVEVKLSLAGGTADALDNLRITLVSPGGTHSELNHYFIEPGFLPYTAQNDSPSDFLLDGVSNDTTGGNLVWTFSTNRSWGERSDDSLVFDVTTAEPVVSTNGFSILGPTTELGDPLTQGWQLHFENWGSTPFNLDGLEVAWHGSPISVNTQRVQGLIGLDENRDDLFNFNRVNLETQDFFGDPDIFRDASFLDANSEFEFFEVRNVIDQTQESFADNITVTARRASDNVIVDQFVTGADGNYYFDLVPDDYIISIDDPLGRTAVDDSLTPSNFLQEYQSEWAISSDFFKVWDYDASLEVPVDGSGTPFAWLDGNGQEAEYGMQHINFLLDPGAPPSQQVDFSGTVYADTNGDGLFNADDVALPDVSVYGDANQNGQFDAGEVLVETDAMGQYALTVPAQFSTVLNVGVITPADWTPTNPATGLSNFFVSPGDTFSDVDFHLQPPAEQIGNGTSQPGFLLGVVYEDSNQDASRQTGEPGAAGMTVFIDVNNTGVVDAGDVVTTTNVHGAYVFSDVPVGTHRLRVELFTPLSQTSPLGNLPITVGLVGAGTLTELDFGVFDTAVLDYGDLPARYGITTLANNGARHNKGAFFLGNLIDGELNGQPSDDALRDDTTGFADEDGIVFDPIVAGGTGRLLVTASRHGGYLSGWMDFNGDDDFDDVIDGVAERLELTKVGGGIPETRSLLVPGVNEITFDLPATIDASTVFSRFRYGEFENVDTLAGLAQIGEVEDYAIPVTPPLPLVSSNGADLDADGDIDGFDFLSWQRGFGTPSGASPSEGDATGDGAVDGDDLVEIQTDYGNGTSQTANLVVESSDFNTDGDVNGYDFLAWQRGVGTDTGATLAEGDANGDGAVNQNDLAVWQDTLGVTSSSQEEVVASIVAPAASTGYDSEPYYVADLLSSQAPTETSINSVLSFSPQATPAESGTDTIDGHSDDIRIIHHRTDDGHRTDLGSRGLALSSNLLNLLGDRAPQLRKLDLSQLTQSIRTRWDRSIRTDQLDDGLEEQTPTRDLALQDLYGSDRRFGRSHARRADHSQLADADHPHDAWQSALDADIDWRLEI
ncbi:MAG: S8 family serine peptidase [Pirellulales bacterium]